MIANKRCGRMIEQEPLSPLVAYALAGLKHLWMPDRGRYAARILFEGDAARLADEPIFGAYYTLNVLLGFSHVGLDHFGERAEVERCYRACCAALLEGRPHVFMLGMALWSGAACGVEPPGPLVDRVRQIMSSAIAFHRMSAQDAAMTASGVIALSMQDSSWAPLAHRLAAHLRDRYYSRTQRLFYNQSLGYRRHFSSFASQVYPLLALYQYGEAFGMDWAVRLANEAAEKVIGLQGPEGEWGWFHFVPRGVVVDFYEVYCVHQHGMAPAFLLHAIEHGVPGAAEALHRGFDWLFGANQMRQSMLTSPHGLFYRSQVRNGELTSFAARASRSLTNAALGRPDAPGSHSGLQIRRECHSYELGWILWSFGDRGDYPEITHCSEFVGSP